MISSLRIERYRGLEKFAMNDLGQINLLVGTNNSGKTSVLEAISLLSSAGDPVVLWQTLWRRGERLLQMPLMAGDRNLSRRSPTVELDVSHLFTGHEVQPGSTIRISTTNARFSRELQFSIAEASPKDQGETLFGGDDENVLPSRLLMEVTGNPRPYVGLIPLTRSGGLTSDALDVPIRRSRQRSGEALSARFVTTESFTGEELVGMWNQVALTPDEDLVLKALQFLDPDIERIAAQASSASSYSQTSRGGFIVKRKGFDQPIPIGSMGDGMWRMLALAIAITQCRGGVLLVDEIDTGLHYTALSRMWGLVYQAAVDMDVQVFATTHSNDCVHSLAEVSSDIATPGAITIQRIESGRPRAVYYNSDELAAIASSDIEVR